MWGAGLQVFFIFLQLLPSAFVRFTCNEEEEAEEEEEGKQLLVNEEVYNNKRESWLTSLASPM